MIVGFLKTIYPISKEPVEIEITASTIVNLQSQGHDGPNIKIQKIEYQNSILFTFKILRSWEQYEILCESNINSNEYIFIEPP